MMKCIATDGRASHAAALSQGWLARPGRRDSVARR